MLQVQSTLDKWGALYARFLVDDIDFTKVGSRYEIDFDKWKYALSGTVSLEPRTVLLMKVDCRLLMQLL